MNRRTTCIASSGILLLLLLAGCGNRRDTSTLPASRLGHWITDDGYTHYYFDGSEMAMVDHGDRMDLDYVILQADESANSMRISVSVPERGGHEKLLEFSAGRDSLLETVAIGAFTVGTEWIYVDSLRRPAAPGNSAGGTATE
jgi:hypothetical protein